MESLLLPGPRGVITSFSLVTPRRSIGLLRHYSKVLILHYSLFLFDALDSGFRLCNVLAVWNIVSSDNRASVSQCLL